MSPADRRRAGMRGADTASAPASRTGCGPASGTTTAAAAGRRRWATLSSTRTPDRRRQRAGLRGPAGGRARRAGRLDRGPRTGASSSTGTRSRCCRPEWAGCRGRPASPRTSSGWAGCWRPDRTRRPSVAWRTGGPWLSIHAGPVRRVRLNRAPPPSGCGTTCRPGLDALQARGSPSGLRGGAGADRQRGRAPSTSDAWSSSDEAQADWTSRPGVSRRPARVEGSVDAADDVTPLAHDSREVAL